MSRKLFLIMTVILLVAAAPLFAAEVANENMRQVGNRILFEFDVTGDYNEDTEVNLTLTIKGKTYTADKLHLEGDYGKIKSGKGKKIYWNVLQDFSRGLNSTVDYDLTAGGGSGFVFTEMTALDKKTNLMWARDANIANTKMPWWKAVDYIKELNSRKYSGYNDWRLPSKKELVTFVDYAKNKGFSSNLQILFNKIGFKNVQPGSYWSSTTHSDVSNSAWDIYMVSGIMSYSNESYSNYYVWPVRAGQ